MIGVLFATLGEARPFLELASAAPEEGREDVFVVRGSGSVGPPLRIGILGMGPAAAERAAQAFLASGPLSLVLNAGICGALQDGGGYAAGSVFVIRSVAREAGTVLRKACGNPTAGSWARLPSARLVTTDDPVFCRERRSRLARSADLVDMEGAAVADAAHRAGVPCTLLKGVSDRACDDDRTTLHWNLERVSVCIARHLWEGLLGRPVPGPGKEPRP